MPKASMGLRRAVGRYPRRVNYGAKRAYAGKPWTFKDRVKAIVNQETGIHTVQQVIANKLTWLNGARAYIHVPVGTYDFYKDLKMITDGSPEELKVRSMSTTFTFSNGTNFPVRMATYEVICRRQCSQEIFAQLADDGPAQNIPHIDPTVGNPFRRFWKIVKRNTCFVQAGQQIDVTAKSFYRTPKTITGDTDASSRYLYPVGARVVLCYFEGPPSEDVASGTKIQVPGGAMNWIRTYKCTYYLQEENDPSTVTTNAMMSVGPAETFNVYTDVTKQTEATDV